MFSDKRVGLLLHFEQLYALLWKRAICYGRQWPRLITQILIPLMLLSIATYYMKVSAIRADSEHGIFLKFRGN